MLVQSYLNFDGRTEEALEFYKSAVGAEVQMLMHFKDSPVPCDEAMVKPANVGKVMHCSFKIGETQLMASDCDCKGQANFSGISLALTAANDAESEKIFAALGEGGEVRMPMSSTFFSSRFGMVTDKFGVCWMVITQREM